MAKVHCRDKYKKLAIDRLLSILYSSSDFGPKSSHFFSLPSSKVDELVKMKVQIFFKVAQVLLALLPIINAAPARRDDRSGSNFGLRGSEALLGYSPTDKVASGSKPDIKYTLLPGQKEDAKIGSYLNFENVDNPQPIRGSSGSDDPGPRKQIEESPLLYDRSDTCFLGNYYYDRINSDKLAPPGTDHGATINAQWPMGKLIISIMGRGY